MKTVKDFKIYIQILVSRFTNMFKKKDTSVIPYGLYCYDIAPNGEEIRCPYFRKLSEGGAACKYLGSYDPDDFILGDMCKNCGINNYYKKTKN